MRLTHASSAAIAIGVSAFLSGGAALAASNPYDGRWSVQVVRQQGDCDQAYRYNIIVENGRARYADGSDFNISGTISPKGAVRVSIVRGGDRADAVGTAEGKWGSGSWKTSGSRACSGSWNAEKRS
jgi:hypothetical protein